MRRLLFASVGLLLASIVWAAPVSAVTPVVASGSFTAQIDPRSITLCRPAAAVCSP